MIFLTLLSKGLMGCGVSSGLILYVRRPTPYLEVEHLANYHAPRSEQGTMLYPTS